MVGFACYLLTPVWVEFWAVRSLRQNVLSVKNSQEAGKAYEALFESGGLSRHQRLGDDQDAGIALRASWRLADAKYSLRTVSPEQFVEFLKRRTGLEVPIWWEATLIRKALNYERERINDALRPYLGRCPTLKLMDGNVYSERIHTYRATDLGLMANEDTTLAQSDGMVVIMSGDDTLRVSQKELHSVRAAYRVPDHCAAHIGAERSFVALHDQLGGRFPLLCVDSLTGNKLWQVDVWGTGAEHLMSISGAWSNDVTILTNGKLVTVFGDAPGGCYAEAFDVESGSNAFRFCTGDWYCKYGSTP
jgi:hypothetical protein